MRSVLEGEGVLFHFYPLISALLSMILAQCFKILFHLVKYRRLTTALCFSPGGMPSSHSALVLALTTALGLKEGWASNSFFISAVFSLIVLYDAAGVRRMVGKQSVVINQIRVDLLQEDASQLSEVLGHTPFEVLVGCI